MERGIGHTWQNTRFRGESAPFSGEKWPSPVLIKICANKKIGEERRGDYPEAGINLEYEGKTNLK